MPRHYRRMRCAFAALAIALATCLAAAAVLLLWLVGTEAGTSWLVRRAVSEYDERIPGRVALGTVQGVLLEGVTLRALTLSDREREPLVLVRELRLRWSPLAMLYSGLLVEALELDGLELHLRGEPLGSTLSDLAPVSGAPEPAEPSRVGPELPLRLAVAIAVRDARVKAHGAEGVVELASVASLRLRAAGVGYRARVVLEHVQARVPVTGIEIRGLSTALRWRDPVIEVDGLVLQTDLGIAMLGHSSIDARTLDADLAFAAVLGERALARLGAGELATEGPVGIEGRLRGTPDRIAITAGLRSGVARLELNAQGALTPAPRLEMDARLRGLDPVRLGSRATGLLDLDAELRLVGPDWQHLNTGGTVVCRECRVEGVGPITASADVEYAGDSLRADLEVETRHGHVRAEARLSGDGALSAAWDLDLPDLSHFEALLAIDPLAGAVSGQGSCSGRLSEPRCKGDLSLAGLALPGASLASGRLVLSAAPQQNTVRLRADLTAADVAIGDVVIQRATLTARGTPEALAIAGRLEHGSEREADLDLVLRPGRPLRVRASTLAARWDGWRGRLVKPVDLTVQGRRVAISDAVAELDGAELRVAGLLDLGGESDLELSVSGLALERIQALLPPTIPGPPRGTLRMDATFRGRPQQPELKIDASVAAFALGPVTFGDLALSAALAEHRVAGQMKLAGAGGRALGLRLEAPLRVDVEKGLVALDPAGAHSITLDAVALDTGWLAPFIDLPGSPGLVVSGHIDGEGSISALELVAELEGRLTSPTWSPVPFTLKLTAGAEQQRLRVALDRDGPIPAMARLNTKISLPSLVRGELDWGRVPVSLEVTSRELKLDALPEGIRDAFGEWAPGGTLDLQLAARGPLLGPRVLCDGSARNLRLGSLAVGGAAWRLTLDKGKLRAEIDLVGPGSRRAYLVADVPLALDLMARRLEWRRRSSHRLSLTVQGLDQAWLGPLVSLPAGFGLSLDGALQAAGSPDDLDLDLDLGGALLTKETGRVAFTATVDGDSRVQRAMLRFDPRGPAPLSLDLETRLPVAALAAGELEVASVPFHLDLDAPRFSLALLHPLVVHYLDRPRGDLRLALHGEGTIGAPRFSGTIGIAGGAFTPVGLGERIRDLDLAVALEGPKLRLERLGFSSGGGTGRGSGALTFDGLATLSGEVALDLERYPIMVRGLPPARLTTRSQSSFGIARSGTELAVSLHKTSLELLALSSRAPRAVPENPNVVLLDEQSGGAASVSSAIPGRSSRSLRLSLRLVDPLLVSGPQADLVLQGGLDARIAGGIAEARGGFDVSRGSLELLGTRFIVERGAVTLPSGPDLEPFIDLAAVAELPDARVRATVRGRASRPELELSSEPALPQYQIVTLLLTGSREADRDSRDQVQGKAANLLLAFRNPELERQVLETIGLDRVGVSFGSSMNQPILTAGKRLSRKLYLETAYAHNAPAGVNRVQGRVELRLTPQWVIETFYGDANIGGIDLFWKTSFQDRPEQKPPE